MAGRAARIRGLQKSSGRLLQFFSVAATIGLHFESELFDPLRCREPSRPPRDIGNHQHVLDRNIIMKGATMENRSKSKGQWQWVLGILVIGAALALFACGEAGQGDLAKKPPPNLGAIADVDGAADETKDAKKPQAGAEQKPAESPAGSQPVQAAPKQ
jgi:hypothetical protein